MVRFAIHLRKIKKRQKTKVSSRLDFTAENKAGHKHDDESLKWKKSEMREREREPQYQAVWRVFISA